MNAPDPATEDGTAAATAARTGTRRRDSARTLIDPHQFRESIALSPQVSPGNSILAGAQASLAALIALPLVHLSPWPHLIGFAALGILVALFGRFAPSSRRDKIVLHCALWLVLAVFSMSLAAWAGLPYPAQILFLSLMCGLFFIASTTGGFGPPGPIIFVFAASASMGQVASFHLVVERSLATAIIALLACGICLLTEKLRSTPSTASAPVQMSAAPLLAATMRIVTGAALAAFGAYTIGARHPGWAALGVMAVMQGEHLHIGMNRAMQRIAGTALGCLLVWMILLHIPSVWVIIVLIALLQMGTEIIIGTNYGLGQILVTPMALLMTYLATPDKTNISIVPERMVDTVIGSVIGIIVMLLFSTLHDRTYLARYHARRVQKN